MYVPDHIPLFLTAEKLASLQSLPYSDLAFLVLSQFISAEEIPADDLQLLVQRSFDPANFPNRIDFGDDIVNVRQFQTATTPRFGLLELWSGPTLAFKDLGMAFAGSLLEYLVEKRQRQVNILVATSGDTGSAALHAVAGKRNANIFVVFPGNGRITKQQELQMTSVIAPNCHVLSIDGTSDDADVVLQALFSDGAFKQRYNLTSINSVNIARILLQIVHFVWAYLRLSPSGSAAEELCFAIPSGGMGNATAGMIARLMGLPCKFLLAVNANNTLDVFTKTGVLLSHPHVKQTFAPSMDIAVPYNLERILYLLAGRNGPRVGQWMADLARSDQIQFPDDIVQRFRSLFTARSVDDAEILSKISGFFRCTSYVLDPHTAIAVAALPTAQAQSSSHNPDAGPSRYCVVATAHWCKFQGAVAAALAQEPGISVESVLVPPPSMVELVNIPTSCILLPVRELWIDHLRDLIIKFNPLF